MTSKTVFITIVVAFTFLILILVVSRNVWFPLHHHHDENTLITKTNTSLTNYEEVKNIHHNGRCAPSNSNSSFENSNNNYNIKLEMPEVELKNNETSIDDDNSNITELIKVKMLPRSMIDDENSTEDNITEILKPIESKVSRDVTLKDNQENNEKKQSSALKNDTESVSTTTTTTTTKITTTSTITTTTTTALIDYDEDITYDEKNSEKEATKGDVKCYGELGCLSIPNSWYHLLHRPLNFFPLSRDTINTMFVLYTRNNSIKGQILNEGNHYFVKQSNFDSKRKTKFIIHGYTHSSLTDWVQEMKNELLEYDDYNVITVDWAGGSSIVIAYIQVVANTWIVGLEIAHFINHLYIKYGLKLDDVHLIGHSLGAHIAGYAGGKLQGKIGRISALDPAKPHFEYMSSDVRLDSTDAQFVDVIHTDSKGFFRIGINHPCGHLDFYPNNGDDQPGCEIISKKHCNHRRAIKLFTESINSDCQFIAYECNSYDNFIEGECFSCKNNNSLSCAIMGYHADKSLSLKQRSVVGKSITDSLIGRKFFIFTGDQNSFCQTHYRITIQLTKPISQAEKWVSGLINVTLHADDGIIHNMQLTPNNNRLSLRYGGTTKVVTVPPASFKGDIGRIRKVELTWTCRETFFLFCCVPCYDPLYVKKIIVEKPDLLGGQEKGRGINKANFSSTLYSVQGSQNYTEVTSGSSETFVDDYEEYKDT